MDFQPFLHIAAVLPTLTNLNCILSCSTLRTANNVTDMQLYYFLANVSKCITSVLSEMDVEFQTMQSEYKL